MKVAVYCKSVTGFGGGVKYGLLFLRPLLGEHDVTIFHDSNESLTPDAFTRIYGIAMEGLTFVPLNYEISLPRLTEAFDVFINVTPFSVVESRARVSLLIVFFPQPLNDGAQHPFGRWPLTVERLCIRMLQSVDRREPLLEAHSKHSLQRKYGAVWVARRVHLMALRSLAWRTWRDLRLGQPALATYTDVITISRYSAAWVKRYYGRDSRIVSPPIDVDRFQPMPKQPIVLSVGRFEPGDMSKKHEALLSAFRDLHDNDVFRGWRMVICGGSVDHPGCAAYVDRLRRDSAGYPVSVEVDLAFERLQELYSTASLYWHAMGLGEDAELHPIRFEHFGMTTAEAMAAGCVPMAIAAGGQPEIITHGINGYLWHSLEELKSCVQQFLATDAAAQDAMREAARRRARDFSFAEFYRSASRVYNDLGVATRVKNP